MLAKLAVALGDLALGLLDVGHWCRGRLLGVNETADGLAHAMRSELLG